MAVSVRSRRLVNSARRKRKAAVGRRKKMTAKQIKYFGTARQRAALKVSRSRKRNAGRSSIRRQKKDVKKWARDVGNFSGKSPIKHTTYHKKDKNYTFRKKRRNVGEIVSISLAGLGNPGRKRRRKGNTGMARHRKLKMTKSAIAARRYARKHRAGGRRRNSGHRVNVGRRRRRANYGHRRRRNSAIMIRRVNHRRRRNPMGGMFTGVIGRVLGVTAGALGARYVPQLVLGGNNTGIVGYVGNLVSAFALGYVGNKAVGVDFGSSVIAGGIASTLLRILSDNTSIGSYITTALSGAGRGGDVGLGIIQNSSFFAPQVAVPGSMTSFITPSQTRQYVSAQMAQTAQMKTAGGMGTVFGRRKRAVM